MKPSVPVLLRVAACAMFAAARGGEFRNLDFEETDVIASARDRVEVGSAFPGWTVYIGGKTNALATTAYYNEVTLGFKDIALFGPGLPESVINGNYTMWFRTHEFPEVYRPSFCQIGQIPSGSNSLIFNFYGGNLQVMFAGSRLKLHILQRREQYTVIGADISEFAGQTGELCFTAGTDEDPVGGGYLDDIRFSTVIGEPKLFIINDGAGLMLSWPLWAREFDLESSKDEFGNWTRVEEIPAVQGAFSTLSIMPTNAATFFRLRRR